MLASDGMVRKESSAVKRNEPAFGENPMGVCARVMSLVLRGMYRVVGIPWLCFLLDGSMSLDNVKLSNKLTC